MAKLNTKAKPQPDSDLFVYGGVFWLFSSVYMALLLWAWLGPRDFFVAWVLCGLTAISTADTKFRRRDSERYKLGVYSFGAVFYLILGPTTILFGVLAAIGHYLVLYTKETKSPAQES
jgi:hypothetical protein